MIGPCVVTSKKYAKNDLLNKFMLLSYRKCRTSIFLSYVVRRGVLCGMRMLRSNKEYNAHQKKVINNSRVISNSQSHRN